MSIIGTTAAILQKHLNSISRGARDAKLGDCIYDLINANNDMRTSLVGVLTKLDTANLAGMGNNNVATLSPKLAAVKLPENR